MDRRIAPSVRIEAAIEAALLDGFEEPARLTELGRLGARLILQRAVEDEVEAFLGRARYERTPEAAGSWNGHRPRASAYRPPGRLGAYLLLINDSATDSDTPASSTASGGIAANVRSTR
ncbi:MAG: hypothetical protein AABZ33_14375 [Chloroflexota bacterium]